MVNDEFNEEMNEFEMSRYIDLELYHKVERSHPFYMEMVSGIHDQIRELYSGKDHVKSLEIGAGTGLLTELLLIHPNLVIDALEIDAKCCKILSKHVGERVNCICGDAVTYHKEGAYDLVISCFAHDHIVFDRSVEFVCNIRKNLKKGGFYVMGGEILPFYSTETERIEALYKFHGFVINQALREGNFKLAQVEINALESGIKMIGDFKRHEDLFEEEMLSTDFELKAKIKVGPQDVDNIGGIFVYVYKAI